MMKKMVLLLLAVVVLASACSTRSISDSGYRPDGGNYGPRSNNPFYRGELSELDVLGIDAGRDVSEADIAAAASEKKERLVLKKGDSILLIQSGAMIPDKEMSECLEKYFSVSVFTGVPEQGKKENEGYSKALRLAAAKAGIGKILVYWGVLESGRKNLVTKSVSWVPIVGWALPDSSQEVRMKLKVALVDVASGQWETFSPKAFDDVSFSSVLSRSASDQAQVALLKTKAYQAVVESTVARYVR